MSTFRARGRLFRMMAGGSKSPPDKSGSPNPLGYVSLSRHFRPFDWLLFCLKRIFFYLKSPSNKFTTPSTPAPFLTKIWTLVSIHEQFVCVWDLNNGKIQMCMSYTRFFDVLTPIPTPPNHCRNKPSSAPSDQSSLLHLRIIMWFIVKFSLVLQFKKFLINWTPRACISNDLCVKIICNSKNEK